MKEASGKNSRRIFIGKLAAGTAVGLSSLTTLAQPAMATPTTTADDSESWFKNAKGKHRIVYDASEPHNGFPFIWSWVFYVTNNETGTPDSDMTAMVVLRHNAMPFALNDSIWKKYNLGELFKIDDKSVGRPSQRNLYYEPREGDFPNPAIEGMKAMQARGAMFCVCNMALKVYSGMAARAAGLKPEEVYEEWKKGVLPGVQVVPSGVWAIGRAQQNGFAYCYAGG
jgi:intracellular sulfur oxidation DsrE/DsrF family protein